jgi:hypothetical protein
MAATRRQSVIFHAGLHKTGTSQLQRALERHAAALAPGHLVVTRSQSPAFAAAAEAAREYSNAPDAALLDGLRHHLDLWVAGLNLAPDQGLIASSEDFVGLMPGHRRTRNLSAAPVIAQAIADALTARFGDTLDLTLIYTTREPQSWLKSVHWQLSKHPGFLMPRDRYMTQFFATSDHAALVRAIAEQVPGHRVTSAALETCGTRRLGMVEAIYDLIDLPDALRKTLNPAPMTNPSPLHDLADAYVALNRAGIPRDTLKRLKLALLASSELDRDLGP